MTEKDFKKQELIIPLEWFEACEKRGYDFKTMLKCAAIRAMDKKVESIKKVDLSDLKMPVAAVHVNCLEYPGKAIVRIFDMDKPTDVVIVKDTIEEIQKDIQENTTMVFMQRGAEDVESLVGVWM